MFFFFIFLNNSIKTKTKASQKTCKIQFVKGYEFIQTCHDRVWVLSNISLYGFVSAYTCLTISSSCFFCVYVYHNPFMTLWCVRIYCLSIEKGETWRETLININGKVTEKSIEFRFWSTFVKLSSYFLYLCTLGRKINGLSK